MTISQRKNLKVYSQTHLTTTLLLDIALNYSHLGNMPDVALSEYLKSETGY